MSLDIELIENDVTVYSCNITNNLQNMVSAFSEKHCMVLWHPETLEFFETSILANEIVYHYEEILEELLKNRKEYERYNSPNGWGTYDDLLSFLVQLISYCHKYPKALVTADT